MITENWTSLKNIPDTFEISKDIQAIHCDTRDFYVLGSLDKPELYQNPQSNLETWHNKGIKKINSLLLQDNRKNYTITSNEIIPWLKQMCEKVGGYDKKWRFLHADVKDCKNWELKYIRFIRNNNVEDEFIVCNSYLTPIHYKEVFNKAEIIQ